MQKQPFNHAWRFDLESKKKRSWNTPDYASWRQLDLPHDWSIELPLDPDAPGGPSIGYFRHGMGTYAKVFDAPQAWAGKKVFVEFEAVYMNAEIWLNEHYLTRHPYGYTSFLVDLTDALRLGEQNVLKVRVDNTHQPNSRWYSGSGIYRPVWMIVAEPLHIAHWGVYVTTPEVSASAAKVSVKTTLQNESPASAEVILRSRIIAPDGAQVAASESALSLAAGATLEAAQTLSVSSPSLWSIETPSLYRLESELLQNGALVDSQSTTFGIRTLEYSPTKGFLLNGKMVKMKGGCVHHDNGVLGSTSFARSEERKVEIHKASGYNAIRCAHNPPAPAFLDACDRLGMLVIDEAFDCWTEGKNPGDYHVMFNDWWKRDIDSMVLRDRNHPCVVLWSIGNEVMERDGRSKGVQVAHMLASRVTELDPTRPVTAAQCGIWGESTRYTWESTDGVFAELGVGGYNYQYKNYKNDHARHPERMMIGTESTPMEALDHWLLVESEPYVLGDFVWTSLDYLGEAGIGMQYLGEKRAYGLGEYPWNQANCGDLDLCGFKRPQSYYRDLFWNVGTRLYIAVHDPVPADQTVQISYWGWPEVWPNWTWTGREGQTFKVDVYSAFEQVELFLNGRSLGVQPSTVAERYTASFEVPYEAGELKAVGLKDGQPAGGTVIRTASPAVGIRLTADRSLLSTDADLSYVTVEIVDASGMTHPAADRPVYFSIKGAGSLAAVGSAKPDSEESYRGNMRTTYRGRALAVVKTGLEAGEIRLSAMADGLDGAEITLTVK